MSKKDFQREKRGEFLENKIIFVRKRICIVRKLLL